MVWYSFVGFHYDFEATKYISEAHYFIENKSFSQSRYLFYFSTIAIIALALLLKLGLMGAIFIIMAINLFAYFYFFKALQKLVQSNFISLLLIVLLIGFFPYQSWTLFLYSESIFYSMVLLLFSHLILFKQIDFRFLFFTALLLGVVVISRPLGILFVLPVLIFIYFHLTKKQKWFFYATILVALVLLNYIVQVVFTTTPDWNMQRAIFEESLICDVPGVTVPKKLEVVESSNQLYQLFYYITHNFSHFSQLAVKRLQLFFLLVRDYYTPLHNVYLLCYCIPIYIGIIWGFRRIKRVFSMPLFLFVFITILLFAITIAIQCDDWHNRFYLTLMPLFFTAAVIGFTPKRFLLR